MSEILSDPELEVRKEQFVARLADFLIEAGQNGWAAEAPKVDNPQRPGFKELVYQREDWKYRDSYAGYYMAPGSSVIYYKERPVWYMTYGGRGQSQEHFALAKVTYDFLRNALMQPEPRFPVRGLLRYAEDENRKYYRFNYKGDLSEGSWTESIDINHRLVFSQRGDVGLIIDKDEDRNPIYPWDL
jgi:hypothetical protein